MSNIEFKIIEDPVEAKEIWEIFSEHKVIDDEWDFRNIWTQELELPFHFIVGYEGDKPIGLLALQRNTIVGLGPSLLGMDKPYLEFFGGVDTDDNRVFLLPGYEDRVEDFLNQIKEPAILTSLRDHVVGNHEAEFYLNRFEVNIEGIKDYKEYVDKNFEGKTRRNILRELKGKGVRDLSIEVKDGKEEDLELLFKFSIDRFGDKSSFHMEQRRNVYRNLMKKFDVDLFLILLNGEVKAVVYAIVYKNTYVGVNTGYDYLVPNLGKLVFTASLERALKRGCTVYDVGQGSKWKEQLHIPMIPQYKLSLNLQP